MPAETRDVDAVSGTLLYILSSGGAVGVPMRDILLKLNDMTLTEPVRKLLGVGMNENVQRTYTLRWLNKLAEQGKAVMQGQRVSARWYLRLTS